MALFTLHMLAAMVVCSLTWTTAAMHGHQVVRKEPLGGRHGSARNARQPQPSLDDEFAVAQLEAAVNIEAQQSMESESMTVVLADSVQKHVQEILKKATVEIQGIVNNCTEHTSLRKEEAMTLAQIVADRGTQLRDSTMTEVVAATSDTKGVSTYSEVERAGEDADKASKTAEESANTMLKEVKNMKEIVEQKANAIYQRAEDSAARVKELATTAADDVGALAKHLVDVGATSTARIRAELSATAISKITTTRAADLKATAEFFKAANFEEAENLKKRAKAAVDQVKVRSEATMSEEETRAERLAEAANEAKARTEKAKEDFFANDAEAVRLVGAAAKDDAAPEDSTSFGSPWFWFWK